MKFDMVINGTRRTVDFIPPEKAPENESPHASLTIDGRTVDADAAEISPSVYSILVGGRSVEITVEENEGGLLLRTAGREFQVEIVDPRSWRSKRGGAIELEGRQRLVAPMPGKIVRVLAATGQEVKAGEGLLVIEAMKMQNEIRSPKSGRVEKVAREGQTVNAGEVLAIVS
jgi:biotin carboxyl carrier protein